MDSFTDWTSCFLSGLLESLPNMDSVKNWFVSLISCLAIKINPIIEKITGHKFNVETDTCAEEITLDGGKLLHIVSVIGAIVIVIVVVYLLCKVIFGCCKVIFGCCCGRRGRIMKAPGRNYRIYRDDFERNPANYFRNLRNNHQDLDIIF